MTSRVVTAAAYFPLSERFSPGFSNNYRGNYVTDTPRHTPNAGQFASQGMEGVRGWGLSQEGVREGAGRRRGLEL